MSCPKPWSHGGGIPGEEDRACAGCAARRRPAGDLLGLAGCPPSRLALRHAVAAKALHASIAKLSCYKALYSAAVAKVLQTQQTIADEAMNLDQNATPKLHTEISELKLLPAYKELVAEDVAS